MRLFADDSSLFTRVEGVDQTQVKIIKDLQTVSDWAHQWKMVFNPDITKQAIEVIFSVKKNKPDHPELIFNDIPVARQDHTKHLGVFLGSRLNFSKHIKEAIIKAKKGNISLRSKNINPPFSRTDRYDNSFFPFCIKNWNNLDDATK